jgi:hypothetical protein
LHRIIPAAHVCQSSSTVDEDRLTERSLRVDDDERLFGDRKDQPCGPPALVSDAAQVPLDHVMEHALAGADHREQAELLVAVRSGVILENLGPVGLEPVRGQRVFQFALRAPLIKGLAGTLLWSAH